MKGTNSSSQAALNSPPMVPDHALLRPIGRGAYGEVWLARNVMGVLRAVKVVERRNFDSDRPYEREFAGIQRYEPVSRLTDGLVHVLHVGRNDELGYFYYVMELADAARHDGRGEGLSTATGAPENTSLASLPSSTLSTPGTSSTCDYEPRTLRSDLKRRPRLPINDCLHAALDVVGGLTKLHENGLVHRDVKPGNIIFVNGRAKLADIGLVSLKGEGRTFVGTEGYIPPEGPGSPGADLYALGMVLYEAATGYAPDRFPRVPAEWFREEAGNDALEFHEVVLKACEGAKERRYQNADEMQADLALLQSGQSVRHLRTLEARVGRWRRIGWAAAVVMTVAVTTALVANWRAQVSERMRQRESALLQEARNAHEKESDARTRAEDAKRDAHRQLNTALFEEARALVLSKELGHRTRALEALERAAGATNTAEMRRVAFAALALPDLRLEGEVKLPPDTTLAQPDPVFSRIAVCQGVGPVRICSLPSLDVLATLPASTNRESYVAMWSGDGRFLAVKRQHDTVGVRSDWEVWDLLEMRRIITAGPGVAHNSVTFHPRQPLLMMGYGGGRVREWDLEKGREARTFKFPNTPHALAYSPDGRRIAASYRRGTNWVVAIHDATNPDVVRTVDYPVSMEFIAWHPRGRWVTGTSLNPSKWARAVHLIDAETGAITTVGEHKIKTALTDFTADGDFLVSGGWDRQIICWDLRTLQRAFTYAGTAYRNYWGSSGRHCAVELPDNVIQFFTFERPGDRHLTGNPADALHYGQFSNDGRWLAVRDDLQLCVWDLRCNAPAALVPVPLRAGTFFSQDSTELFAGPEEYSQPGFVGRWRLGAGTNDNAPATTEPLPVKYPAGLARAAAVGNELVMLTTEGVRFVALTNLASGEGRTAKIPAGWSGSISPDGRWLAMLYNYSPVVGIYRLPQVEEVARVQTSHYVGFATFSPRSDELLVINRSGVEWFDTATWQCTRRRPGTPVSGAYAFYTPDGKGIWLVTHFRNGALLDQRTLEPLLPLPNDVLPLALSPDGRELAVSFEGRRVGLWDMESFHQELAKLKLDW